VSTASIVPANRGSNWLGELSKGGQRTNVDTDGDGLADGWEARFGSSAVNMEGAVDFDVDGLNNTEEFGLGTIPPIRRAGRRRRPPTRTGTA